jgi:hypothetical protein
MHFRFFSASMGRFQKPDSNFDSPLSNPQGWNLYSYVKGNPVNFNDPTGHQEAQGAQAVLEADSKKKAHNPIPPSGGMTSDEQTTEAREKKLKVASSGDAAAGQAAPKQQPKPAAVPNAQEDLAHMAQEYRASKANTTVSAQPAAEGGTGPTSSAPTASTPSGTTVRESYGVSAMGGLSGFSLSVNVNTDSEGGVSISLDAQAKFGLGLELQVGPSVTMQPGTVKDIKDGDAVSVSGGFLGEFSASISGSGPSVGKSVKGFGIGGSVSQDLGGPVLTIPIRDPKENP